jgi:uncharacterized membrane protein
MNDAHLHLVLNHLPIILPVIGLFIMIGGLVFKSEIVKRTAFLVFILGAIVAIPAFATGEGAEEVIEELSGIDENLIKTHEEIAEKFAILCYVLGSISLLGLWANFYKKSFATIATYLTILICMITLYFAKQTGTTGGEIRHSEIRENSGTPANKMESKEKDD